MGCRPLMSSAIVPRFSHSRSTSPWTFSPTATTRLHNRLSHHGSARRRDRLGAASLGSSAPGGLNATSRMDASVSPNSRPRSNTTAQLVSDRIRPLCKVRNYTYQRQLTRIFIGYRDGRAFSFALDERRRRLPASGLTVQHRAARRAIYRARLSRLRIMSA